MEGCLLEWMSLWIRITVSNISRDYDYYGIVHHLSWQSLGRIQCQRCYSFAFIRQGHELLAAVLGIHSEREYFIETGLVYFWVHSYLSGHNTKYELSRTYFIHTDLFPHQPRDKLLIPGDPRARGVEDTLLPREVDAAPDLHRTFG